MPGDTKLVDLCTNLDNAEPLVVATALVGQRGDTAKLSGPTWTVISSDKSVQARAREFGLAVKTNQEYLVILEEGRTDACE